MVGAVLLLKIGHSEKKLHHIDATVDQDQNQKKAQKCQTKTNKNNKAICMQWGTQLNLTPIASPT